jgi:hypothetical protein
MRILVGFLLFSAALCAQDLTFYIDNSGSLSPLGSTYALPGTAAGTAASVTPRVVNTSANQIEIISMVVSTGAGSTVSNSNFSITGLDTPNILAAQGGFEEFTLSFTPAAQGQATGFLVLAYAEQQNGCVLQSSNPATQCPTTLTTVSQLQGTASAPQIVLTENGNPLQPNTAAPIYFGNVAVGSSATLTFTLTNEAAGTVTTPSIAIQVPQFSTSQFSVDTSAVPQSLAGSASANFTVTFTPAANAAGPANPETATLVVGPNSYQLQGAAVPAPGTGNDGFQITWTDKTGVKQTGTTVQMGPDPTTTTLTFTVSNPDPDATEMLQTAPTVSSPAFSLQNFIVGPGQGISGSANAVTSWPVTLPSGWALTFQVSFTPSGSSGATGVLTIAPGFVYNLVGKQPAPLNLTLMCGATPCSSQSFTSQQQVQAALQWANTSSTNVPESVDLTLSFSSGVNGIKSDPAIYFMPRQGTMEIGPISFSQDSATGTFFGGGSQFTFQTGTTEGTITLTATGLEGQTQTWSFDIPAAQVQITSITAQAQASNLVVTVDGYDNTYTAGQLSFTFYNTSGGVIGSAIAVDASSKFHNYFFGSGSDGGAFQLQASFPVNGDVTQVGSVSMSIQNSSGTTTTSASF